MKRICLLLLSLVALSSCSQRTLTAEVIGEAKIAGTGLRGAVAGKINGTAYLFLADLHQIEILDVNNPRVPRVVSHIDVPRHINDSLALARCTDIELSGTTLYIPLLVTSNIGVLWIVDVGNPLSPREIAILPLKYVPMDIAISNNLACIVTFSPEGFLFFDISDPRVPRLVNNTVYPFPEKLTISTKRIQLRDSMLYVLDGNGLVVIDIINPASPKEIGFYPNPNWDTQLAGGTVVLEYQPKGFLDFAVSGKYAYVTSAECGLRVINILDPNAPCEAAHLEIKNRSVFTALIADNLIYLLERNLEIKSMENPSPYGIIIVDVTNPLNPAVADVLEEFTDYSLAKRLIKIDNHVFFPCQNTLYVISTTSNN